MPPMRDEEKQHMVIGDFKTWLRNVDRSAHTIRSYVGTLTRFAAWFQQTNGAAHLVCVLRIRQVAATLLNSCAGSK